MNDYITFLFLLTIIVLIILSPLILWLIAKTRSRKLFKLAKSLGMSFQKKDKLTLHKNIMEGKINGRAIVIHDKISHVFTIPFPIIMLPGLEIKRRETVFYIDGQMNILSSFLLGYPSMQKIKDTIESIRINKPVKWSKSF